MGRIPRRSRLSRSFLKQVFLLGLSLTISLRPYQSPFTRALAWNRNLIT